MDITMEDVEVCNCCGAPHVIGVVSKVQEVEDATDKEFWLCEECRMHLKGAAGSDEQVNVFIADMSVIFSVWAMAESGKGLDYFLKLARIWNNWGLNCD